MHTCHMLGFYTRSYGVTAPGVALRVQVLTVFGHGVSIADNRQRHMLARLLLDS